MSVEIPTAFVKKYESDVTHLVQQSGSKLRGTVLEDNVEAEVHFVEQVGKVEMVKRTVRHADTPLVSTPHRRRAIFAEDFEIADLVDTFDKLRIKISPGSAYMEAQRMAAGRQIDRCIIASFDATAYTGKDGTTPVALPATQIIQATGTDLANSGGTSTNLTIAKLRRVSALLGMQNVDGEIHFAGTHLQKQHLLRSTKATSFDYAAIKALVNGEVNSWMGMTFHWFGEGMLPVAANIRDCFAWVKTGAESNFAGIKTRMSERDDKSYSLQVYACITMGCARLEEEKVVKVQCDEADATIPANIE